MPPPARTHLPLKPDPTTLKPDEDPKKVQIGNGTVYDENDPRENEVHPELQRLSFLSLRGTFSKAYALLVRIASKVGWDELLRFRSQVFVMEEEYRIHRALVEEKSKNEEVSGRVNGDGGSGGSKVSNGATSPVSSAKSPVEDRQEQPKEEEEDVNESQMEAISLDDDAPTSPTKPVKASDKPMEESTAQRPRGLSIDELMRKAGANVQQGQTGEDAAMPNPRPPSHSISFSFKNKRLCDKWLDNQFMILYQDIRLYSLLKQVRLEEVIVFIIIFSYLILYFLGNFPIQNPTRRPHHRPPLPQDRFRMGNIW